MTIIYEMDKRSDGLYQWRQKDGQQWHIAQDLEEVISTIRRDAFSKNAHFQVHYIGRNASRFNPHFPWGEATREVYHVKCAGADSVGDAVAVCLLKNTTKDLTKPNGG